MWHYLDIFAVLGLYAAYIGSFLLMFSDNLSGPTVRGPAVQSALRKILEVRRSHSQRDESLKFRLALLC